jgi:hypothetical protein
MADVCIVSGCGRPLSPSSLLYCEAHLLVRSRPPRDPDDRDAATEATEAADTFLAAAQNAITELRDALARLDDYGLAEAAHLVGQVDLIDRRLDQIGAVLDAMQRRLAPVEF